MSEKDIHSVEFEDKDTGRENRIEIPASDAKEFVKESKKGRSVKVKFTPDPKTIRIKKGDKHVYEAENAPE